jgi:predicted component of type VI protein secretion system
LGHRKSIDSGSTMKAELIPENGDPPIPVVKDLTLVGRHEDCDVVIENPGLSKRHCVLVKTDGLLVIRDLATTNGTKVKGQRVRWAALLPDDRISLGGYKLRVYLGSDEIPSPSEQWAARRGAPGSPGAAVAPPLKTSTPAVGMEWAPGERSPEAAAQSPGTTATPSPIESPGPPPRNGQQGESAGSPGAALQFELLEDDDDEIIDLE